AEDGIRDFHVTGVQTCALPISSRLLPLFVGEKDGQTVYVAPIRGKGLWDAIWGYVALDKNMVIQGVFFDHAGETPGLGANIKQQIGRASCGKEYRSGT